MRIQCRVVDKDGVRCTTAIEVSEPLSEMKSSDSSLEVNSYICSRDPITGKPHKKAEQIRAMNEINRQRAEAKSQFFVPRIYDPVKDEADKRVHFQDVAWDPELGGRVNPLYATFGCTILGDTGPISPGRAGKIITNSSFGEKEGDDISDLID